MNTFMTFEIADYLDSDEMIAEFLTAALEDENPEVFIAALDHVAKATSRSELVHEIVKPRSRPNGLTGDEFD